MIRISSVLKKTQRDSLSISASIVVLRSGTTPQAATKIATTRSISRIFIRNGQQQPASCIPTLNVEAAFMLVNSLSRMSRHNWLLLVNHVSQREIQIDNLSWVDRCGGIQSRLPSSCVFSCALQVVLGCHRLFTGYGATVSVWFYILVWEVPME